MDKELISLESEKLKNGSTELTLAQINTSASVEEIVQGFVPTPRFSHVSFESYQPDHNYPSQAAALERLGGYVNGLAGGDKPRDRFFGRWLYRQAPLVESPKGLYLDGGYGVGKTHLLASAYLEAPSPKAYLSFEELTYTFGAMGMQECIRAFSAYRMLCIDEFELDDVGNTMLAKTFLSAVTQGKTRIITTSNTLPTELGQGRFAAQEFKREIGIIAATFEVIRIEGEDYRHRHYNEDGHLPGIYSLPELRQSYQNFVPTTGAKLYTTFDGLCNHLEKLHPIRYARLLTPLDAFFIEGLAPIENQTVALRFVHFIDKLYDQEIGLAVSSSCTLPDLFMSEYRDKGYRKKYQRCLSRLTELLKEWKTT
ncbi:MAG: cell division protein ZapE [Chloroflexota bacterium]|nr:cell division protein ZapE [Chloroflexota bacterium]